MLQIPYNIEQQIKTIINLRLRDYQKNETSIFEVVRNIACDNECTLKGLEYRFKEEESCYRKVLNKIEEIIGDEDINTANINFENLIFSIKDYLRYSIVIERTEFINKYEIIKSQLTSKGYILKELKNRFKNADYKDLITWWMYDNFIFEIQFHTADTFHRKQIRHHIYAVTREYEPSINQISTTIMEHLNEAVMLLYKDCPIPDDIDTIENIDYK